MEWPREGTPSLLTKVLLRLCGKCWGLFRFQSLISFHSVILAIPGKKGR